jgi:hypothetical protein
MTSTARATDATTKLRRAISIGGTVIAILVAIGVSALFLTMTGAGCTGSRHELSAHARLVRYCGTGAPAAAVGSRNRPGLRRIPTPRARSRPGPRS